MLILVVFHPIPHVFMHDWSTTDMISRIVGLSIHLLLLDRFSDDMDKVCGRRRPRSELPTRRDDDVLLQAPCSRHIVQIFYKSYVSRLCSAASAGQSSSSYSPTPPSAWQRLVPRTLREILLFLLSGWRSCRWLQLNRHNPEEVTEPYTEILFSCRYEC